jgi:hypothetical protein
MTSQWDEYRKLEMLPDSVSKEHTGLSLLSWVAQIWQGKPDLYSTTQQRNHLERCLEHTQFTPEHSGFWRRTWQMLSQPIGRQRSTIIFPEPQITQVCDRRGQLWWQVYDPMTGQTKYLDSETEVQIWLEEHPYP